MTLDEAIQHLNETIPEIECGECRKEHEQLRAWLIELKHSRATINENTTIAFIDEIKAITRQAKRERTQAKCNPVFLYNILRERIKEAAKDGENSVTVEGISLGDYTVACVEGAKELLIKDKFDVKLIVYNLFGHADMAIKWKEEEEA